MGKVAERAPEGEAGEGLRHEPSLQPSSQHSPFTGGFPPACRPPPHSCPRPHPSPLGLPHILPGRDPLPGLAWSTLD